MLRLWCYGIRLQQDLFNNQKRYWEKSPKVMAYNQESRDMLLKFINRNAKVKYRQKRVAV